MRPVVRGPVPAVYARDVSKPYKGKVPLEDTRYKKALSGLEGAIGSYCSYCEMPLQNAPEIEHILPKSKYIKKINDWDNFLLSCKYCNTIKAIKDVISELTAFPHKDNTFRCFAYQEGRVKLADLENPLEYMAAENLIELVGLDRIAKSVKKRKKEIVSLDRRYLHRETSYIDARESKKEYVEGKLPLSHIIRLAKRSGNFSVWMTVFDDSPEVKRALINAFPGTAKDCFDENAAPLKRPGGLT